MKTAEDIFAEVLSIVEAHRVVTATVSESLVERADALQTIAPMDPRAIGFALSTVVITNMYAEMTEKLERAARNPEYAEALFQEFNTDNGEQEDGKL